MAFSTNAAALLVAVLAACVLIKAEAKFSSDLESVVDLQANSTDEWDYSDGPRGPAHWGNECSSGVLQSPIDINLDLIHLDNFVDVPAHIYYSPAPAFVYGDGKILEVQWEAGTFNMHDFDYALEKLVFHTPSEHTYSTKRFPLEVQFYHTHITEGVAINSIVFEEGEHNGWLEQFLSSLPTKQSFGETLALGMVNATGVGMDDVDWTRYFRYMGSLTTPPCTESPIVYWSLLKAPLSASKEQIQQVEAALLNKSNARPIPTMPDDRWIFFPRSTWP